VGFVFVFLFFLTPAASSGIQSVLECPVALTPILTPTPVNAGERTAAGSKTHISHPDSALLGIIEISHKSCHHEAS
jgi:hypothetical protein